MAKPKSYHNMEVEEEEEGYITPPPTPECERRHSMEEAPGSSPGIPIHST